VEEERLHITSDAPGFTPVPLRLLQDERIKDPSTIAVYVALASFASYGTAQCFPSFRTIGKRARCSADAVARHVELLVSLGYVEKASGKEAGKPNTYHLTDAWGRKQGTELVQEWCRMDAVGGAAPVPDKRNSMNETQEREREARTPQGAVAGAACEPSTISLSSIIAKMKTEAQAQGAPPSFVDKAWSAGILELCRSGVGEGELLEAFKACLEQAPDRVTFFPRDFLKWRKVCRDRIARERQHKEKKQVTEALAKVREAEGQEILRERGDPQVAARIEAEIARLPWKRWKGGAK
jgi:hypothetical protein